MHANPMAWYAVIAAKSSASAMIMKNALLRNHWQAWPENMPDPALFLSWRADTTARPWENRFPLTSKHWPMPDLI